MPTVPNRIADRIVAGPKNYAKILAGAIDRDIDEADTVVAVTDILSEAFRLHNHRLKRESLHHPTPCDQARASARPTLFTLAVYLCWGCWRPLVVYAADPWIAQVRASLGDDLHIVHHAQHEAHIIVLLAVAIGVIGVVLSATQGITARWVKLGGAVLGILVGCLTVVREQMYPFSPSDITATIVQLESKHHFIERQWSLYEQADDISKSRLKSNVETSELEIEGLLTHMSRSYEPEVVRRELLSDGIAYAGSGAPEKSPWQTRNKEDQDNIYFVGCGMGESLAEGQDRAEAQCRQRAERAIVSATRNGARNPENLRVLLERLHSVDVDVDHRWLSASRYRVQVLMALSIRQAKLEEAWQAAQTRDAAGSVGLEGRLNAFTKSVNGFGIANSFPGSVDDVFDDMPHRFNPCAAVGMKAVFQYELTGDGGGRYYLVVDDEKLTVGKGVHNSPNLQITISAHDWLEMENGRLEMLPAFMSGRLKIAGDMGLYMALAKLFP